MQLDGQQQKRLLPEMFSTHLLSFYWREEWAVLISSEWKNISVFLAFAGTNWVFGKLIILFKTTWTDLETCREDKKKVKSFATITIQQNNSNWVWQWQAFNWDMIKSPCIKNDFYHSFQFDIQKYLYTYFTLAQKGILVQYPLFNHGKYVVASYWSTLLSCPSSPVHKLGTDWVSHSKVVCVQNEILLIIIGPEKTDHCLPLSVTHWLTHSWLVDLIDATLACKDANS